MAAGRVAVEQDFMIERVQEQFECRVLWSEGRPCLEYTTLDELDKISAFVRTHFDTELLDVFFTAVESLPMDNE